MDVESVRSLLPAEMVSRKTEHFAILIAARASMELDQSAGKTVPQVSVMMAPSATSLMHMVEVSVMRSGMRINAIEKTPIWDARSGELFGILGAEQTSTMLHAASAHQTAHLDRLISAYLVLRTHMAVELVRF